MILNNKAQKTGGGGILCEHTEFNLLGGEVRDNFAKDFGGGVYLSNHSTINIYGGKISYNRMARDITSVNNEYGVGVYCKNSNFYMYSGEISNNYDGRCGGGLALDNGSYGALFNGKIKDNGIVEKIAVIPMQMYEENEEERKYYYEAQIELTTGGEYGYTFRVMPKHEMLLDAENLNLVKWIEK